MPRTPRPVKDHNGKVYPSQRAMCEAYGITVELFRNRVGSGWDIEKILTEPVRKSGRSTRWQTGKI